MKASLFIQGDANFSPCGKYRWTLDRIWAPEERKPWIGWVMLNPSTADAMIDDPTIRRCIAFSQAWGFSGLTVMNLFALRATDPAEMLAAEDPVGPGHDERLADLPIACPVVVCAWGVHGAHRGRDAKVVRILRGSGASLRCLGLTKDGHPRHPLYVNGSTPLQSFGGAA